MVVEVSFLQYIIYFDVVYVNTGKQNFIFLMTCCSFRLRGGELGSLRVCVTKGEWKRNGSPLILGRSGLWVFGESYFYIILNISIIKTKPREAMRARGAGAGAGPAQGLVFGPMVLIWGLLWAPLCSRGSAGHTTPFLKPGKPTSVLDPTPGLPVLFPGISCNFLMVGVSPIPLGGVDFIYAHT